MKKRHTEMQLEKKGGEACGKDRHHVEMKMRKRVGEGSFSY